MVVRGKLPEPGVRAKQIQKDADSFFEDAFRKHLADIVAEDEAKTRKTRGRRRSVFIAHSVK